MELVPLPFHMVASPPCYYSFRRLKRTALGVASNGKMIVPSFPEKGKLAQKLKSTHKHSQIGDLITLRKKGTLGKECERKKQVIKCRMAEYQPKEVSTA